MTGSYLQGTLMAVGANVTWISTWANQEAKRRKSDGGLAVKKSVYTAIFFIKYFHEDISMGQYLTHSILDRQFRLIPQRSQNAKDRVAPQEATLMLGGTVINDLVKKLSRFVCGDKAVSKPKRYPKLAFVVY
jgi:hypothetical protein